VGVEGDGFGPWVTRFGDAAYAECPISELPAGGSVTVPAVLLCRAAGQFTLPMTCAYSVAQLDVSQPLALTGAIALHVVHPVFAQLAVHDTLCVNNTQSTAKHSGASASPGTHALPTDANCSRFIELAEGGAGDEHGTSHLAHSHAGLPPWGLECLPAAPKPKLYASRQRHIDGTGQAVPRVGWGKPFFVACRLMNNLRCRVAITSIRLEAHAESSVRVLHAPSVDGAELDADEELSWHCALAATEMPAAAALRAGTMAPKHEAQLGTLIVTMQRVSWDAEDPAHPDAAPSRVAFANEALASALLQSTFTFEVGMPAISVEDQPCLVNISAPVEAKLGEPFAVQLCLRNPHPVRPATLRVALGDDAAATLLNNDNASGPALTLRANSVDVAGRTSFSITVPPGQARTASWRAMGTALGHQSLPAIIVQEVVREKPTGARLHDASHQHAVFITA